MEQSDATRLRAMYGNDELPESLVDRYRRESLSLQVIGVRTMCPRALARMVVDQQIADDLAPDEVPDEYEVVPADSYRANDRISITWQKEERYGTYIKLRGETKADVKLDDDDQPSRMINLRSINGTLVII